MKRVLTAVVLIPVVLLIVFRAPLWLFALVVAGIIVPTLSEYLKIAEKAGCKPFRKVSYLLALLPILFTLVGTAYVNYSTPEGHYYSSSQDLFLRVGLFAVLVLSCLVAGIALVLRREMSGGMASSAATVMGVLYIGGSLSLLVSLRSGLESFLVIFVLFSVWAGDIAAYYVGRSIGRHKLAPVVSPNKSWEGAIASVIASVGIAALVFHYQSAISIWMGARYRLSPYPLASNSLSFPVVTLHAIILGVVTNAAAQFGDLFESALKRGAGVKDSGELLPGHGGMLDRIDALLFAIPVVWCYATLSGLFVKWTFYHP